MKLQETIIKGKLYYITYVNGLYTVKSDKDEYYGTFAQCKKWLEEKGREQ